MRRLFCRKPLQGTSAPTRQFSPVKVGRYSSMGIVRRQQSVNTDDTTQDAGSGEQIGEATCKPARHSTGTELDPFNYTSGRWLNHDQQEMDARHIQFDFTALCRKAVELCHGSHHVTTWDKIEGGFNRVFVFTMDNDERIIARLPTSVAGPPRLVTNSEVATMTYLSLKTTIPVPEVLSWSDDSSNPTGTEYIFMRPVGGVQLHSHWESMTSLQHVRCINSVSDMIAQMTALEFPAYGSLYFSDVLIPDTRKKTFENGFCIGPHCGSVYWNCGAGEASIYGKNDDQGPWADLRSYCNSLIVSAYSRIPKSASENLNQPSYQGSIEDHYRLVRDSEAIINELIEAPLVQSVAKPTLLHADLHKRNILVSESEPTRITGLIDWQSTSIEPAFMYASDTPDFAAFSDISVSGGASDIVGIEGQRCVLEQRQKDIELCAQAFDVCMKGYAKIIGSARAVDDAMLRPFYHCNRSWKNSAAAVREDLLELSRRWTALGLPGQCPYQPADKEIALHKTQYDDFEAMQGLKSWLVQKLRTNSDGWVPAEIWDSVLSAYREALEQWIHVVKHSEASEDLKVLEEKAKKLWPFDQR